jgi:hypothetical protein
MPPCVTTLSVQTLTNGLLDAKNTNIAAWSAANPSVAYNKPIIFAGTFLAVASNSLVSWHRKMTCAPKKDRICLRHNLSSQTYGSKSLVRSTGSAVWNF